MEEKYGKLKERFIQLGYEMVIENELGVTMVKEDISTCLVILKDYDEEQLYEDSELRALTIEKYPFAEKGTICIFMNHSELDTIKEIENCKFYALKVHESHVDCIPYRKEDITLTFKPIESTVGITYQGYMIDPYKKMDGVMSQEFYRYLSSARDGDTILYPKIIGGMMLSWFRYVAQKQYKVKILD